ncbi:hypothetical protein [Vibrio gangliei]|uniref:hypothetical protein n=1 Tax=Vibrio gangliei TaxID=2077090 RepID=UPI000D01EEF8|nr:hypothetical protein [Vibrio gangliei]
MKKILFSILGCISFSASAAFVNPMDFDGSEAQKQEVITYIQDRVKKEYCDSGLDMCQPTTLRMMEKQNLDAFKQATQLKDKSIMDRVIKDYCHSGVDMCNYTTILMMYKQNEEASKQTLDW